MRSDYYIVSINGEWPEEFADEECVFLDIMANSSAEQVVRLWGYMDKDDPKWWPAVFYKIYNVERELPCDVLPNLKPGKRLDLRTKKYVD